MLLTKLNGPQAYQINLRQKGSCRDRRILEAIAERQALDADQVRALFFGRMEYGQRKAQERLQKLFATEKIRRDETVKPFAYFAGEKSAQLTHRLGVNWARIWLEYGCSTWEKLHSFSYEQDYGVLRADGFAAIKNTVSGKFHFAFVEYDRSISNAFDKAAKYCKLFDSGKYSSWWWVELTDRFPPVLVVTTSPARKGKILEAIKKENSAGLEFRVMLLDEVKKEVMGTWTQSGKAPNKG
jgi:hypothetical protein